MKKMNETFKEKWFSMYNESVNDKENFFNKKALKHLTWDVPFTETFNNEFGEGNSKWFFDGKINACFNCVDRHLENGDKLALICTDNDNNITQYTYKQLYDNIVPIANYLKSLNLPEKTAITIYMPMSDTAIFSALACARLGITHNVVFGGYSAQSLVLRLMDSDSSLLITIDETSRGTHVIDFLANINLTIESLKENKNETLKHILVFNKSERKIENTNLNVRYWSEVAKNHEDVPCVPVDSEHPLFYLYTSGSTGNPKGIIHSTGGYLLYALLTTKYCFNVNKDDIFMCTADIGWITGHSYVLYGPLLLGCTTVIFSGLPTHPSEYRIFDFIEKYKVTHFYTAPTAIRVLQKIFNSGGTSSTMPEKVNSNDSVLGSVSTNEINTMETLNIENIMNWKNNIDEYDLSSLKALGTVGEPINEDAYLWYSRYFGKDSIPIIDTYWQTEAGGVMISPVSNVSQNIPECACLPFLGMQPIIVKNGSTAENIIEADVGEMGELVFRGGWPGVSRGIIKDMDRFRHSYFEKYPGHYYTGDEGYKDKNGYFWVRGRVDDVLNVSGHRLSTAEIESAACRDKYVAEAAVVGISDEITGQAIVIFAVAKNLEKVNSHDLIKSLKNTLRVKIGPIIHVKRVILCEKLPKTRTGKIMRRVLRSLLMGKGVGDVSTCSDSGVIDEIRIALNREKMLG